MAAPRLLGLPRELRDLIFSFIHHDVSVAQWHYQHPSWNSEFQQSADVVFTNLPSLRLMLVNFQLSCEFREAACSKKLPMASASFKLGDLHIRGFVRRAPTHRRVDEILAHTRAITVLPNFNIDDMAEAWRFYEALTYVLHPNVPQLCTLYIKLAIRHPEPLGYREVPAQLSKVKNSKDCLYDPPTLLTGLPLAGYVRGLETRRYKWKVFSPSSSSALEIIALPGIFHYIVAFGEWTFTAQPNTEVTPRARPSNGDRGYSEEVLASMTEQERRYVEAWWMLY